MELIVAITDNFVIGMNGGMPWHLPKDLARFKKITTNNTIVMGRKTWESIGRALPNRMNVVLSHKKDFVAKGATVIHSLGELEMLNIVGKPFIIGGGTLYKQSFSQVNQLHITRIHTTINGDTFFPKFDETKWTCIDSILHEKDNENQFDLSFETWSRI